MNHVKTNNKELNRLLKLARNQQWRIKPQNKGGHIKCYSPDGQSIVNISTTTKSLRGVENAKSTFKRAGLKF